MTDVNEKIRKPAVVDGPKVQGSLPLYAEPRAVHSITHAEVGILPAPVDFGFAAKSPLVPLTVDEFTRAGLDYPILFFGADRQPYAVAGLEEARNLFITEGAYRAGAYIPAYLRRYPFVFARDEDSADRLILCIDHASDRVTVAGAEGALPLFDGNEPTALTRQALEFCEAYEAAGARTRLLLDLLDEHGLLVGRQAHYTAPGAAEPTLLLDYLTIDADRLAALDDAAFLRLRTAGALPAIYAQIASQALWEALPLLGSNS